MQGTPADHAGKIVALDLGPLPIAAINGILASGLAPGDAHFSARAQNHARVRHPADFDLCRRHVARIVSHPDYIGQGPDQKDGFELIGAVPDSQALILVAIKFRPDRTGRYIVASMYLISRNTLERRLRKGFARSV